MIEAINAINQASCQGVRWTPTSVEQDFLTNPMEMVANANGSPMMLLMLLLGRLGEFML